MLKLVRQCIALFVLAGLLASTSVCARQRTQFITVGTGGVTGVYYSVGGAICQLVNQDRSRHGLRCSVEATAASVYNIHAVRDGELDFGLAQSDVQYAGFTGRSGLGVNRQLRSVFSLHPELVTVVARKDSGIKRFEDLRRKRVNIGVEGSGTRTGALALIRAMGMNESDFASLVALKPDAQAEALCSDRIDAFIYIIGHPAQNIVDAVEDCDGIIMPLAGPGIEAMMQRNPSYVSGLIAGGTYAGHPDPIKTYGVRSTVIVNASTSPEVVYQLVKSVFDNFAQFSELHPALADLDPKTMIRDGLTAPLHEGAVRYYKERGWL